MANQPNQGNSNEKVTLTAEQRIRLADLRKKVAAGRVRQNEQDAPQAQHEAGVKGI